MDIIGPHTLSVLATAMVYCIVYTVYRILYSLYRFTRYMIICITVLVCARGRSHTFRIVIKNIMYGNKIKLLRIFLSQCTVFKTAGFSLHTVGVQYTNYTNYCIQLLKLLVCGVL